MPPNETTSFHAASHTGASWAASAVLKLRSPHVKTRKILNREDLRAGETPGDARQSARRWHCPDMLENGQTTPIMVRAGGVRFVLIEGLHRLEAAKALGEKTLVGFRVDARKH